MVESLGESGGRGGGGGGMVSVLSVSASWPGRSAVVHATLPQELSMTSQS